MTLQLRLADHLQAEARFTAHDARSLRQGLCTAYASMRRQRPTVSAFYLHVEARARFVAVSARKIPGRDCITVFSPIVTPAEAERLWRMITHTHAAVAEHLAHLDALAGWSGDQVRE